MDRLTAPTLLIFLGYRYSPRIFQSTYVDVEEIFFQRRQLPSASSSGGTSLNFILQFF